MPYFIYFDFNALLILQMTNFKNVWYCIKTIKNINSLLVDYQKNKLSFTIQKIYMEPKTTNQLFAGPRLAQLDGLRGLAILGVLGNHFEQYYGNFQSGWLGVSLFFVLSGFLITRILINQKNLIVENASGFLHAFKTFYIRRAFRIFPLYYLVLLTLFLFDINNARQLSIYLVSYTFNFIVERYELQFM